MLHFNDFITLFYVFVIYDFIKQEDDVSRNASSGWPQNLETLETLETPLNFTHPWNPWIFCGPLKIVHHNRTLETLEKLLRCVKNEFSLLFFEVYFNIKLIFLGWHFFFKILYVWLHLTNVFICNSCLLFCFVENLTSRN